MRDFFFFFLGFGDIVAELHLDFETRSAVDLKKSGPYVYAEDPTTQIILFSWCFGDGPIYTHLSLSDEEIKSFSLTPHGKEIINHVKNGYMVVAQNATFERLIWNSILHKKFGWPKMTINQCRCTMVQSYALGIPGSLDKAAPSLGISEVKDAKGQRVMMKLSKPKSVVNGVITWNEGEEDLKKLQEYGRQDVVVERMLDGRQAKLSPMERAVWELDQKINDRGIKIDVKSASRALEIVEKEKDRLNERMRQVTKGAVSTCTATGQLTDWIRYNNIQTEGVAKNDVTELLKDQSLPREVKEALSLRAQANKSSNAKLKSMICGVNRDFRIRGTLQYHGAATGRWAGRRLQVQNFPRGRWGEKEINDIFNILPKPNAAELIDLYYGDPISVISDCLRSFIEASVGHRLIWGDYSAIEARVLAWLSGEEAVLDVFRNNKDIYKFAAMKIFGCAYEAVTKEMRQIGKVAVLALGYQGGVKAFNAMAVVYGVNLSDKEADGIKVGWREGHPNIVRYWYEANAQAINAVKYPGQKFKAGAKGREVTYLKSGSFLLCRLPSGRVLSYPYPKIEQVETPWHEKKDCLTYMGEDSVTKKWDRHKAYGGLLVENITQAVARDLLSDAMLRLEAKSYPIVFHVHDEIVCEVVNGYGSTEEMTKIMSQTPLWAKGLPISVEGDSGVRYRK